MSFYNGPFIVPEVMNSIDDYLDSDYESTMDIAFFTLIDLLLALSNGS